MFSYGCMYPNTSKMKLLLLVAFALLNTFINGEYTNVNSCEDGSVFPKVKVLAGLNNSLCIDQPCVVVPGRDISMDISFVSPRYLENIKPDIMASSLGVSLDYPLFQDNACDGIVNTYCPLVKHEQVRYVHSMHLLNVFPEVTVTLKFTIIDKDDSSNVLCFIVDIKVVKE